MTDVFLSQSIVVGGMPPLDYGHLVVWPMPYLSAESGLLPDLVIGVLGKGVGRIYGTVARKGDPVNTPLRRKVRLFREVDGLLVREMWSDAVTGEYEFRFVDELQTWTVIAYDYEHNFRAVIADNLTPEVMP